MSKKILVLAISLFVVGLIGFSNIVNAEDEPSIIVTSPNGGEKWEQGKTYNISWEQKNFFNRPNIFLYDINNPNNKINIFLSDNDSNPVSTSTSFPCFRGAQSFISPGGIGACNFAIPFSFPVGSNYKIIISSSKEINEIASFSFSDKSDAPFSIVVAGNSEVCVKENESLTNASQCCAGLTPYDQLYSVVGMTKICKKISDVCVKEGESLTNASQCCAGLTPYDQLYSVGMTKICKKISDVCVKEGESLTNASQCCAGLTPYDQLYSVGMTKICKKISDVCVKEGESLTNASQCCAGLTPYDQLYSVGMTKICKKISDVCVKEGESLTNASQCCAGLTPYDQLYSVGMTKICKKISDVCVKENESLGAVVSGNNTQCCEGLEPYITPGIIGTRGICKNIFNDKNENGKAEPTKPQQIETKKPIDIPYKDGSLLRAKNGKQVYVVQDETLKAISSPKVFKNYNFKLKDIIAVDPEKMEKYEIDDEALLPYPDGTLLKAVGNGKIFFIQDEKIRAVSSPKIFRAYGFKVKNVITIARGIMEEYEMGEPLLPYPDGTLLKIAGDNKIYFVQDDSLRYVSSLKALKALGLKRKNIIIVTPEEVEEYEDGEPLN